jgi:hypothetical protein
MYMGGALTGRRRGNIRNENSTDKRKQNVRSDRENELEFGIGFKKAEQ